MLPWCDGAVSSKVEGVRLAAKHGTQVRWGSWFLLYLSRKHGMAGSVLPSYCSFSSSILLLTTTQSSMHKLFDAR